MVKIVGFGRKMRWENGKKKCESEENNIRVRGVWECAVFKAGVGVGDDGCRREKKKKREWRHVFFFFTFFCFYFFS